MNLFFRPHCLAAVAIVLSVSLAGCGSSDDLGTPGHPRGPNIVAPSSEFDQLERTFDARLGVYALDTGSGAVVQHEADTRFAYASTHKVFSSAAVLEQNSMDELNEKITYSRGDLVDYSPVTEKRVGSGMTLLEICDAAIRFSDNTAANILFEELGGPERLDLALDRIGDDVTRVSRDEPTLNTATPGDTRDTSTPRALAGNLKKYVLGNELTAAKRTLLVGWLRANTTGDALIRAGVPSGWIVGDKTGSASYGTRNDIAVVWPPEAAAPIVIVVMSSRDERDAAHDDELIAEATQIVVDKLSGPQGSGSDRRS